MMHKFLTWLTDYLPAKHIPINGKPYLDRFFLFGWRGYNFYLHYFYSGDGDRGLHNHPWRFSFSIVLAGEYVERVLTQWFENQFRTCAYEDKTIKWFNVINKNKFHQVINIKPNTWTLFFITPKTQHWGFIYAEKHKNTALVPDYDLLKLKPAPAITPDGWWKNAVKGKELRASRLPDNRC